MANYGVFSEGQIWVLASSEGWSRGYPTRQRAIQAASEALRHDEEGSSLIVQDETGLLSSVDLRQFLSEPSLEMSKMASASRKGKPEQASRSN